VKPTTAGAHTTADFARGLDAAKGSGGMDAHNPPRSGMSCASMVDQVVMMMRCHTGSTQSITEHSIEFARRKRSGQALFLVSRLVKFRALLEPANPSCRRPCPSWSITHRSSTTLSCNSCCGLSGAMPKVGHLLVVAHHLAHPCGSLRLQAAGA